MNLRLSISTDKHAPHPLDARILELAKELRTLLHKRGRDRHRQSIKGKPRPPEVMAKIIGNLRSDAMKGKHHTPETKAKLRKVNLGRKHSPEAIMNMKAAQQARYQLLKPASDPWAAAIFGDR